MPPRVGPSAHGPSGEIASVTFSRDAVRITSYQDDAIRLPWSAFGGRGAGLGGERRPPPGLPNGGQISALFRFYRPFLMSDSGTGE